MIEESEVLDLTNATETHAQLTAALPGVRVGLLRLPDLATDTHLLAWARRLAPLMLDQHPDLARQHVARWLGGKAEYLKA